MCIKAYNSFLTITVLLSFSGYIFAFPTVVSTCYALCTMRHAPNDTTTSRSFEFIYNVALPHIPKTAKGLSTWIPLPQSDNFQVISNIKIECPVPYTIDRETTYNNKFLNILINKNIPDSLNIRISFVAQRKIRNNVPTSHLLLPGKHLSSKDLLPNNLIPIDGQIKKEAKKVTLNAKSDMDKVSAIYDHIVNTVTYDKSGTGWGRGDALYACNVKAGNCTDFHSLFIGMCRSIDIPARFIIGFPLPEKKTEGEISGYHCWAEFFISKSELHSDFKGWIPVDASEAFKHPEMKDFYFGNLDYNRIQFTIGRDIELQNNNITEVLNYFIYPFCTINDEPYYDVKSSFYFREIISQKKQAVDN
ncbi:MAG: transglutaminase domain-containing protein [Cytophagales bacterium]|nr:transglutaminase domain-containing protein [Cytophagales bacterium]